MGCQCKVARNLERIQKLYGTNNSPKKKTNIKGIVSQRMFNLFILIITIPIAPIFFCINVFKSLTHKTIKFSKLVRPIEHVRS